MVMSYEPGAETAIGWRGLSVKQMLTESERLLRRNGPLLWHRHAHAQRGRSDSLRENLLAAAWRTGQCPRNCAEHLGLANCARDW